MSEVKLISPMLDDFMVGNAISEHNGVRCYPAMKNGSDTRYILKVISIPASQTQTDALLLTGAYNTVEEVTEYFSRLAQDVQNELGILDRLAKMEGFFTYEACQIIENEQTAGFDIYLLGLYKRSLERHFRKLPMTHLAAVNLGLDLCASMTVCRQSGYLYADLKPGNIFFTEDNEYRIGDLGFLPIVGLKYATLPDRYRSRYTPPELNDPFAPISTSIDIYAAGLILYQAYNGGELPFTDNAPAEVLPPPLYADYEMSEIILKACAPDPADRWEDPIKMGQALVGYMQRNSVNDTPIIPPPAQIEETPQEPVPFEEEPDASQESDVLFEQADEAGQMMIEQMLDPDSTNADAQAEAAAAEETSSTQEADDALVNLSFLDSLTTDETAPQEDSAGSIQYDELTADLCDILEQADNLIAHEIPTAPAVAEPVEAEPAANEADAEAVALEEAEENALSADENAEETDSDTDEEENPEAVIPEEIAAPDTADEIKDTASEDADQQVDPIDETVAAITEALTVDEPVAIEEHPPIEITEEILSDSEEQDTYVDYEEEKPKKSILNKVLAFLLAIIIVACLAVAAFFFYREYYIKTIDKLQVEGVDNQLTVSVSTSADHSLLTVVCTDTYGNRISAPLLDGYASFDELTPDMLYTITVEVEGFHGVNGEIRTTYTTAPQTEIVNFTAVTGAESGSAILNFTIKGHDFDQWKLSYVADGEAEQNVVFSGHMVTVTGLSIGKTYTFTLDAASYAYVVGQYQLQYSAIDTVYPENLDVTVFDETGLTINWDDPKDQDVKQWTVICYNDSGYSSNLTTEENTAQFTDIDPTASYTVEVTAAGMSVGGRFYISKNAVTVTGFQTVPSNGGLRITWDFAGATPASPWILSYAIGDSSTETAVTVDGTSGFIPAIAPGATYKLKLQLQDGTTVIGSVRTITLAQALPFTGYGVSTANMTWQMCVAPSDSDWNWRDVRSYQDSFKIGEKAGFVVRLNDRYGVSEDPINVAYVIRDSEGAVVSVNNVTQAWLNLWFQYYGEFTIPVIPQTAGQYTIDVYFNGASVHHQNFTVTE